MTSAEKNIKEIQRFLNQYADGWLFVGFNPKDGEPMVAASASDTKTKMALNALAHGVMAQGGAAGFCRQDPGGEADESVPKG